MVRAVLNMLLNSQAFNYMEKFGASVPTLPAAVTLCRLLSCLAAKTDVDSLRHRTSENLLYGTFVYWVTSRGKQSPACCSASQTVYIMVDSVAVYPAELS